MAIKLRKVGSGITEKYEVWTDEPVDDITFCDKVLAIRQFAIDHAVNKGTQLEVCRLLVEQCDQLLKALDAGDLEAVGWLAFELGEQNEELVIKWGWEGHALRGKETIDAAARGGSSRARARQEDNKQRNKEMAEEFKRRSERSNKSATELKKEIGREHGLGRTASIEAINDGLKISSG